MSNIKVYVIFHSIDDIDNVLDNELYSPLMVGTNGGNNYGFCSDDSGDNISYKNPNYCELTGLYWMCKNSPYETIGLVHYRRYFAKSQFGKILNKEDIEKALSNHDLIIPKRTDMLEGTLRESIQYNPHLKELMGEIFEYIKHNIPEYVESWNDVMDGDHLSFFNMFIGKKDMMISYCEWLFPILDYIFAEKWKDEYASRAVGFLSEILFNIWIHHNNLKVIEVPLKVMGTKLKIKTAIKDFKLNRFLFKHVIFPIKKRL